MKIAISLALLCSGLICHTAASAQEFPQRAITIIDPYPAGGSTDVMSRVLGERISKSLGKPVIVEAKPGAAGTIGANFVARSQPDGHTLLIGNPAPNAIAASTFSKLPYDVEKDFQPVTIATMVPTMLCVAANSPLKSPADVVALGKSGGNVNFGSSGTGGLSHIVGEMFNKEAGVKFTHVPYRGAAPLLVAAIAGEVHFAVVSGPDARPHVRGGKLRCVANAGARRSPQFPDVPTLAESGLPAVKADVWFGYFAPAGTPRAIVDKLKAEIASAMADPAVKARFEEMAMTPVASSPDEFAARIKADRQMYGQIVKAMGLQLD